MVGLSSALNHRMDYLIQRQGMVASNIANADTPDYLTRDLTFQRLATQHGGVGLRRTNSKHLAANGGAKAGKEITSKEHMTHNGNSVQMDVEMLKLNDIQLNYNMATQLYRKHMQLQNIAVRGSR